MLASLALRLWPVLAGPPPGELRVEPRVYEAVRTREKMTIDGRATERVWTMAAADDRFTEREPALGQAPPVRTVLQVAYDDLALYVLVRAQADMSRLVHRNLRRDVYAVFADDNIALKIDPHHDRRSAFTFGVSVGGVQFDSMTLEDGRVSVSEWDGVWEAEVDRQADGFTVELRIPFAILGIKGGREITMGLDLARDSQMYNATYDWRLIVPPRHPVTASSFGDLVGIRGIGSQRALEFTPFALARTDFEPDFTVDPRRRPNLATGADARLQIGAGSYAEASVLTDFAQVEVDQVQVARDRFPLFFPERRPFFINGLDIFNFGRAQEAQLFFSRRVGLASGRAIPIAGGAKAYGRWRGISYGVLDVQTMRSIADDDEDLPDILPENVAVGRVRFQTTDYTSFGVMGLGRHRFGLAHADHAAGGVDLDLRALDGQLRGYGFVARSFEQVPDESTATPADRRPADTTPGTNAQGNSASASLEYQGLYVRPGLLWLWSDRQFSAPLGFYRRPRTAQQSAWVMFAPRPTVAGLRDIQFGPGATVTTEPDYSGVLTTELQSTLQFNWRVPFSADYAVTWFDDLVQAPFSLYLFQIDAGRYRGFRQEVGLSTPENRAAVAQLRYRAFDLFGGFAHEASATLETRFSKHLRVGGAYTHLVGHLERLRQRFDFGYLNGNVDIALTRNLVWDNIVRLNLEPGAARFGVQSRFRWRYRPGSDLFVLYRTDIPLGLDPVGAPPRRPYHELTIKVAFYLRALLHR